MIRIALFAVAYLVASSAQAQVHKCVRRRRQNHLHAGSLSGEHEAGSISRGVTQAPAAAPADSAPRATRPERSAQDCGRAGTGVPQAPAGPGKAAKESEQKSAEAQRKAENCRNARERLTQYEIGGRQSRINAQGERYYLDDSQIDQEKARARADVAQSCS